MRSIITPGGIMYIPDYSLLPSLPTPFLSEDDVRDVKRFDLSREDTSAVCIAKF